MEYLSLSQYLKNKYGEKIYKIALDGGFTCPNRDGKISTGGCIFCNGGSGAFAQDRLLSIEEQIEKGKGLVEAKLSKDKKHKYIAYFQSYTGTYDSIENLRQKYLQAINHPDIAIVSIATRPDCLSPEIISLLTELNQIKPIWIELGLQTIHETTATYINRGYPLSSYDDAMKKLNCAGIEVIVHVILGLKGETKDMILDTVKYVAKSGAKGIKLQLLHILSGTPLADLYYNGQVNTLSLEHYTDLVVSCLKVLPEDMVIHRLTGDGAKSDLIAPLWSKDKKMVLNTLTKAIKVASRD